MWPDLSKYVCQGLSSYSCEQDGEIQIDVADIRIFWIKGQLATWKEVPAWKKTQELFPL